MFFGMNGGRGMGGFGGDNWCWIFIIILLCCCCGDMKDDCWCIILLIIIICCCCGGNSFGCGHKM